MMSFKEDNKDMDVHWNQAQHKLQEAMSSLCEVSANLTTSTEDRNANPVQLVTASNTNCNGCSAVDFVSIFAENNLVSEERFGDQNWNKTLPANFQRQKANAERPRTLTPPPEQSGKQRFRKRDWKFYAYGKYRTLIPVQKKHEYSLSTTSSQSNSNLNGDKQELLLVLPGKNVPVKSKNEGVTLDKIVPPALCDNQSVCAGERKVSRLDINVNFTDQGDSSGSSNTSSSSGKDTASSSSNGTSEEQGHSSGDLSVKFHLLKTGDKHFKNKDTRPLSNNKCTLESCAIVVGEEPCNCSGDKQESSNDTNNTSDRSHVDMDVSLYAIRGSDHTAKSSSHELDLSASSKDQVFTNSQTDQLHHTSGNAFSHMKEELDNNGSVRLVESSSSLATCEDTQDEGTMTYFRRDSSSTSDAYYRESSLSPSTPDAFTKPIMLIPPPPALDKHEARLKDTSRTSHHMASTRTKSNERKCKKKIKLKDKRDASPSKTDRPKEGKVSTGTQTQRSVRGYKGVNKSDDHSNNKTRDTSSEGSNSSKLLNSHDRAGTVRKTPTESSTSSDESGDYKKVNITALKERFVKTRGKSQKHTSHNNNIHLKKDITSDDVHQGVNSKSSYPESVSLTQPVSVITDDNSIGKETNYDILENDMYEENEDNAAVTNGVVQPCFYSPMECSECTAEGLYQYSPADSCLQPNGDCKQWGALKHSIDRETYVYCHEYQQAETATEAIEVGRANICQSCREKCEQQDIGVESAEAVIIPPREQRRMWGLPLMPVIVEDAQKSEDSEPETTADSKSMEQPVKNVNNSVTMHTAQRVSDNMRDVPTSHHGAVSGVSVCQSSHIPPPVSPGAQSTASLKSVSSSHSAYSHSSGEVSDGPSSTTAPTAAQPVSLLDKLHKKYYPGQYKGKAKESDKSAGHQTHGKDNNGDMVKEVHKSVTLSPKDEAARSKPAPGSFGVVSPRLRRLSPRQPEEGEEGKPPPSPTFKDRRSPNIGDNSEVQKNTENQEDNREIEALEACKWLRAAGFPQYAQMYEDQQFPIDIASVEKDHDFLDPDSIQSLFRRLNTLNKCAGMKIDAPLHKTVDESDEEDQCALSDKWRYQRSSRRWSRKDLDLSELVVGKEPVRSTSSQDSLLTDNEENTSQQGSSPLPPKKNGARENIPDRVHVHITDALPEEATPPVNLFDNLDRSKTFRPVVTTTVNGYYSREGSASPNLRRVQSEKVHTAKSFFKRIESFKTRKSTKKPKLPPAGTKIEIGDPIVVNTEDMKERMERLGCKDISPKSQTSDMSEATQELTNDLNTSYSIMSDTSDLSPVLSGGENNTTLDSVFLPGETTPSIKNSGHNHHNNNNTTDSLSIQSQQKRNSDNKNEQQHTSSEDSLNRTSSTTSSSLTTKSSASSPRDQEEAHQQNHHKLPNLLQAQPDLNTSELDRVVFSLEHLEPHQTLASFPKVIPNGFLEVDEGQQLNYRTGSFNLGSHSEDYREHLQAVRGTRAASEEPERETTRQHRGIQGNPLLNANYRMSVYDNLGPDTDPQQELDKILKDLLENIDGLNQSLGNSNSESLLELGTFGLHTNVPVSPTASVSPSHKPRHQSSSSGDTVHSGLASSLASSSPPHSAKEPLSLQTTVEPPRQSTTRSSTSSSTEDSCSVAVHGLVLSSSKPVPRPQDRTVEKPQASRGELLSAQSTVAADPSFEVVEGGGSSQRGGGEAVGQRSTGSDTHNATSASSNHMEDDTIPSTSSHSPPPLASADLDLELNDLDPDDLEEEDEEEEEEDEEGEDVRSQSSEGCESDEGGDTAGSREDESSDQKEEGRERRDSGVGSSLTRAPSDRRRHRIRWHSFIKSHRPSLNSQNLQLSHMSAGQLMVLRKLCLLKVTGLMEKYSPTNRSGWNWAMPKFIKRFKAPDYKDKNVFGVPPLVILHRTGQPLPQCMLYAMRCLRRTAKDAVGIFRKSGVRSRIQKLRDDIEASPDSIDFESLQPYDVADLIKQYFRELPECLLTNKLSETFISVFTHVPSGERLEALQCAVMLLPDENREVLQSLLLFLSDMASHSHHNQMTASNLAVCFAPSLFHMFGQRNAPVGSPKPRGRKSPGIPDQKELLEQKAAHECLTCMITECKKLFLVPEELLSKCRFSYIEQGDPVPLEELSKKRSADGESTNGITAYIESCIQGLLKESREKFKGWVSVACPTNVELSYKKVGDGHPLRLWKCAVDVEAPPEEVLNRVLRERHLWDVDLLKWRVVEKLDQQTEVFQYVLNSMAPHPSRDFCALRSWRTALPKGACVLVSTSVEHGEGGILGDIRAVILASRFLIEPCGAGKSRLTHICRIDIRGHTPEWYNKAHGHVCATYVARLRDSFQQTLNKTDGPETKI